jgi:type II secretory pathway component GspD/PulD (secretin)
MKTTIITLLTAICVSGLLIPALAQTITNTPDQSASPPNGADTGNAAAPDAATQDQNGAMNGSDATPAQTESAPAENQAVESTVILPTGNAPEAVPSAFVPPAQAMGANPNDLNLNFNRAPLDMVLNYLSDAAGFIVVQDTRVNGTVTVVGKHLTQDEAVDLLNTELNKNGYAATRIGRTLTIMDKNDAKTRNIPVRTGNIPESIPNNDEMVTQIIPIRFVEARQLVSDLSSFVSSQATIVANDAGNSIVVTDTQSNIRHLAEIIQAVDNSAEAETEIRVFRLKYASPTDVANELSSVFPSSTSGNNTQSPIQFRGGGGGGGRFGGGGFGGGRGGGLAALLGGGGSANSSQDDRVKKATQITAVADSRIQAVIVTAPKDLMDQIAGMMTDLDVPSDRDQDVSVISLQNGDPQQVVQVLQNMFQSSGTSRSGSSSSQSSTSPLQTRAQNSATTMGTTTTTTTTGGAGGTGYGGGGGRSF